MTAPVFDHAGVETTDFDADLAWHRGALGARVLRTGTHVVTGLRIVMLAEDGAKVELVEVAAAEGRFTHTAYRVADVRAAATELVAAGAEPAGDVIRIEAACADSVMLRVPGGAAVQLIHYDPDSPDLLPGER